MFMTCRVYVHGTHSYRMRHLRRLPWASPALDLEDRYQVYFSAGVVSRGERDVPLVVCHVTSGPMNDKTLSICSADILMYLRCFSESRCNSATRW